MLEFFQWIVDTISGLISFVWTIVEGLIQLIALIPSAVSALTQAMGILPSMLVGFATATITVCVIFILVGRESGGQK